MKLGPKIQPRRKGEATTTLPKKGKASVGSAPQYTTVLGKNANCQTLVSVTFASGEVPIMLSLFLPESRSDDPARMHEAGVPEGLQRYRTKPEISLEEIDRAIAAGVRFGCVLADAGYALSLPQRGMRRRDGQADQADIGSAIITPAPNTAMVTGGKRSVAKATNSAATNTSPNTD